MEIKIKFDCTDIDWKIVSDTLKEVGMSYYEPHIHKKAFENSHTCVFIYLCDKLIGFGRAISDDAYQAAIYDVAVTREFQAKGIGSIIIKQIISRLPFCNFILYTFPGKEDFYKKLGLRKMKTGMALFKNATDKTQRGFTE